jgi:hypothetical protein
MNASLEILFGSEFEQLTPMRFNRGVYTKISGLFYFGLFQSGIHTVAPVRPSVPPHLSKTASCMENGEH